jgi:hypothetical protein
MFVVDKISDFFAIFPKKKIKPGAYELESRKTTPSLGVCAILWVIWHV